MTITRDEQSVEIAERLVAESTADETEVTLDAVEDRFVRFAEDGPTQDADRERVDVGIRVRFSSPGGIREARATCGSLDPDALRAALRRALTLARIVEPNPELVPLGGPVEVPETAPDRPTLDHTFGEKAAFVAQAVEACRARGLLPAGLVRTTGLARTLVSSTGRAVHGARSRASFSLTATSSLEGGASGFAEAIASDVQRIDPASVVRRAVEKAERARDPRPVEPGEYTVVLEPAAVSALLLFAAYQGFGAQEVHEKASFLCGRIGERVAPGELSIFDDAHNAVHPGLPFDGEGTPKCRVALVDHGILGPPVTDSRWAEKTGAPNTGHAQPQPTTEGPSAQNLVVAPGEERIEDLVSGVGRGLLVTQFHYTNVIEPLDLTLTGMTRNGTFAIENGRVVHAVRDLRFTQSLVGALARITGVGRDLDVAGALFDGEVVCPALRIERFRFTSTTPSPDSEEPR